MKVSLKLIGKSAFGEVTTRLLERLFDGSSRVTVSRLHGGFSGSLVLRTLSYDAHDQVDEPTVTKIDNAKAIVEEIDRTNYVLANRVDAIHGDRYTSM